jgi:hypothetical protein
MFLSQQQMSRFFHVVTHLRLGIFVGVEVLLFRRCGRRGLRGCIDVGHIELEEARIECGNVLNAMAGLGKQTMCSSCGRVFTYESQKEVDTCSKAEIRHQIGVWLGFPAALLSTDLQLVDHRTEGTVNITSL